MRESGGRAWTRAAGGVDGDWATRCTLEEPAHRGTASPRGGLEGETTLSERRVMRAVLMTGHGGLDRLEYRQDVPVPVPTAGEVLLAVAAAGLNNTDIWTREGAYGRAGDPTAIAGWRRGAPEALPRIQGGDIVGHVVEVGPGVDPARIGERVLVDPVLYTDEGEGLIDADVIGNDRDGGFAEYVAVPAANAHAVRSTLSAPELATFPLAYSTAERMLNRARLQSGETVLITGASGGVGSALVQLARLRHARVVALTSRDKLAAVGELGADLVLARDDGHWPDTLTAALAGHAPDVVADVVGGPAVGRLLEILRAGGRYVVAGAIAGPVVTLDLRSIYLRHLELLGSTMAGRREFAAVVGHIETGHLRPLLAGTYPLAELVRAQRDFQAKRFVGKLVVVPPAP